MDKQIVELRTLKVGRYIIIDGSPCKIIGMTHSKPGKHGGARSRVDAVGIFDGQKRNLMKPVSDKVDVPIIEKKEAQVLNVVGGNVQLMDMTSYETLELPVPDEFKDKMDAGREVIYMEAMGQRAIIQIKEG
ncbi:MAG: translation initiation factor IF-5A [Candidatus Altiarchaeota archaeon]